MLNALNINLTEENYKCIYQAFPGRHEGSNKSINIEFLLSLPAQTLDDSKAYENMDLSDEDDK